MTFLSNSQEHCQPATGRRPSFMDMVALYHQRRALAQLDDAALEDLGLTRHEAIEEARRPLWDIPSNWR